MDPRLDIFFSDMYNDLQSELQSEEMQDYIYDEIALVHMKHLVDSSPFATEEFSENNYTPREW